jgi:hypothetical protein
MPVGTLFDLPGFCPPGKDENRNSYSDEMAGSGLTQKETA